MSSGTEPLERVITGSAGHRFDKDQTERLRPINGRKQGKRLSDELVFVAIPDFSDIFDQRVTYKWSDDITKILLSTLSTFAAIFRGIPAPSAISIARSNLFSGLILPMKAR